MRNVLIIQRKYETYEYKHLVIISYKLANKIFNIDYYKTNISEFNINYIFINEKKIFQ